MDAYTSVTEMTEDKVAVCVYMCVYIPCLLYPLTHWWVRMYLLLRWQRTRSLCVCMCVCIPCLLYPLTHWWVRIPLLLRWQRTRSLCACTCVCTYHACFTHSPTDGCACTCYWEERRRRSLCVRAHTTLSLSIHPLRTSQRKRRTGQDTGKGLRAPSSLQASQPLCTLPPSPCGQQSWMPDENF